MSDQFNKAFPVSWDQLHRDAKALAWRLAEFGPWRSIIAVTRGGLVPAAIVARELELRVIDTVCVSSYDHQDQGELEVSRVLSLGFISIVEVGSGPQLFILVDVDRRHLAYCSSTARPHLHS